MGEKKNWFWIVYAVFALYMLNEALTFIVLPAFFLTNEKWILIAAGILLVFSAYRSYKKGEDAI